MSKLIHIDQDYKQWIQDLKSRYRRSQIKASVKVNYEVLSYYWQLGRDIVNLNAENRWGSGFMRVLSQDLKQELPEATGLTQRNLYYCKKFYLLYNQANANLPQVGAELEPTAPSQIVPQVEGKLQDEKLPQLGAEIQTLVSAVPWGHHNNPTIGLLVCKGKDNTLAQYALESSSQPLGISEYELQKLYPTKVEGTIPTIAEIESVAQDTVVKPEENEENEQ